MPQILGEYMRGVLQRLSEENMPEKATIHRPAQVADQRGGYARTFSVVVASVKCRVSVRNITEKEDLITRQTVTNTLWWIFFPLGTDVKETDEVVVNGARRYRVKSVLSRRTNEAMLQVAVSLTE